MTRTAGLHPRAAGRYKARFLRDRATVYGGSTWSTVLLTDVACWLSPINQRQPSATSAERAALAAIRVLRFDPAITIPENTRIEVAGHLAPDGSVARWSVRAGTFNTERAPDGTKLATRCDVTRAT